MTRIEQTLLLLLLSNVLEPLMTGTPRTGDRGWPGTDAGRFALRLGLRLVKGVGEEDAGWIAAARGNGYRDVESLQRRADLYPRVLRRLAESDAFASFGANRREAIWQASAVTATPLPLFAEDMEGEGIVEPPVALPHRRPVAHPRPAWRGGRGGCCLTPHR